MTIDSNADIGIVSNLGARFWDQSEFMQKTITTFRSDRNEPRPNSGRGYLTHQAASGSRQCVDAFYTKLPLIAGITRNVAGLKFAQTFPDEIASA